VRDAGWLTFADEMGVFLTATLTVPRTVDRDTTFAVSGICPPAVEALVRDRGWV
jgi:hypothetical protein